MEVGERLSRHSPTRKDVLRVALPHLPLDLLHQVPVGEMGSTLKRVGETDWRMDWMESIFWLSLRRVKKYNMISDINLSTNYISPSFSGLGRTPAPSVYTLLCSACIGLGVIAGQGSIGWVHLVSAFGCPEGFALL